MINNRTYPVAYTLVNWLSASFLELDADKLLTILEGPNGVGKSSIMMAVYILLMPDQSTFRFRDQQGSQTGTSEIVGRINKHGPVYCAMTLISSTSERTIIGLHLAPRGEAKIDISPFVINKVPAAVTAGGLFVTRGKEGDIVRELSEVAAAAEMAGADFKKHKVGDYLKELCVLGVHAIDMASDKDRKNYGEAALSCMYGGMSKDFQSRLRDFLLPEKPAVAQQLAGITESLRACRRGRIQTRELQESSANVQNIVEKSREMLRYGVAGTFLEAGRLVKLTRKAHDEYTIAKKELKRHEEVLGKLQIEVAAANHKKGEAEKAWAKARTDYTLAQEAFGLAKRLADCEVKLADVGKRLKQAEIAYSGAKVEHEQASAVLIKKRNESTALSLQIASCDEEYRAIQMRAARHRSAVSSQTEFFDIRGKRVADVDEIEEGIRVEDESVALCRSELARNAAVAGRNEEVRSAWETAQAATLTVLHKEQPLELLLDKVETLQSLYQTRKLIADQQPSIDDELASLVVQKDQLAAFKEKLISAGEADIDSVLAFEKRLAETSATVKGLSVMIADKEKEKAGLEDGRRLDVELTGLLEDLRAWHKVHQELSALTLLVNIPDVQLANSADVLRLSTATTAEETTLRTTVAALDDEATAVHLAISVIATSSDSPEVIDTARKVDGILASSLFEEISLEEAPRLQAWLGALAGSIVVDDPVGAAETFTEPPKGDIFLVSRDALEECANRLPPGDTNLVRATDTAGSIRISPLPEAPLLGRQARAKEQERLQLKLEKIDSDIAALRIRERYLSEVAEKSRNLMNFAAFIDVASPQAKVDAKTEEAAANHEKRKTLEDDLTKAAHELSCVQAKLERLASLATKAYLLDIGLLSERISRLRVHRAKSVRYRDWLANAGKSLISITPDVRQYLRQRPLNEEDERGLEGSRLILVKKEETAILAKTALERLRPNLDALVDSISLEEETFCVSNSKRLTELLKESCRIINEELEPAEATAAEALRQREGTLNRANAEQQSCQSTKDDIAAEITKHAVGTATEAEVDSRRDEEAKANAAYDNANTEFTEVVGSLAKCEVELAHARGGSEKAQLYLRAARQVSGTYRNATLRSLRKSLSAMAASSRFLQNLPTEAPGEKRASIDPMAFCSHASELASDLLLLAKEPPINERSPIDSGTNEALERLKINSNSVIKGELWAVGFRLTSGWATTLYPEEIVASNDPDADIEAMNSRLATLQNRLKTSESQFVGHLKHTASQIRGSINQERRRINGFNTKLEKLAFGNVSGARVNPETIPTMERFLFSLQTQPDLFTQRDMSYDTIEEFLVAIYKEITRGSLSVEQILDYRSYLNLHVQYRKVTEMSWLPVNASTGEAIAVGTAIYIMVFDNWEHRAAAARKTAKSMRLLMLDETGRLSADTLQALVSMCRDLEVTLIIAAPATPPGIYGTAYRMAIDINNGEKSFRVFRSATVSGRRPLPLDDGKGIGVTL